MRADLIYDVGMFDGGDTAYYLGKGFSVVAVEANPGTVAQVRERYRDAIQSGQLIVLNVAIAETRGDRTFWVCTKYPALSTFDRAIVDKSAHDFHPVVVPCARFGDILREYGVPHYLKIDIEGSDHLCLADIDPLDAPEYVSFELLELRDLFLLASRGYDRFKCIRQDTLTEMPFPRASLASARQDFEEWLTTRYAHRPSVLRPFSGVKASAKALRSMLKPAPTSSQPAAMPAPAFGVGATGPFGEESHGNWLTLEEVCYAWLHFRYRQAQGRPVWADIHAKRASASSREAASAAATDAVAAS